MNMKGLTQFKMIEDINYKRSKLNDFNSKVKLNAVNTFETIDGI